MIDRLDMQRLADYAEHDNWRCGYESNGTVKGILPCQCGLDDLLEELGLDRTITPTARDEATA